MTVGELTAFFGIQTDRRSFRAETHLKCGRKHRTPVPQLMVPPAESPPARGLVFTFAVMLKTTQRLPMAPGFGRWSQEAGAVSEKSSTERRGERAEGEYGSTLHAWPKCL